MVLSGFGNQRRPPAHLRAGGLPASIGCCRAFKSQGISAGLRLYMSAGISNPAIGLSELIVAEVLTETINAEAHWLQHPSYLLIIRDKVKSNHEARFLLSAHFWIIFCGG